MKEWMAIADRGRHRIERHLAEVRLPVGKTLASFDFDAVPMVSTAQVMALTSGDSWIEKGANLLLFGPPGAGIKSSRRRHRPRPRRKRMAGSRLPAGDSVSAPPIRTSRSRKSAA
jgi:hypothetical protein